MGEVGVLYRLNLAIGCGILMLASIACTGWFFYSWLEGVPGIVGACVGCAVQIMAYGFSGVIVHHKSGMLKTVLVSLIASALALSVLSSYATLNGYFSALQSRNDAAQQAAAQKEQAIQAALSRRIELMESMSRDVELGSEAADQGLADKYRTQANQFLKSNKETREALVEQIEKIETLAQSDLIDTTAPEEASPIDGLSGVLGGQSTAITLLCIWLALMFDALPIVGITLFEARAKQRKEARALAEQEAEEARKQAIENGANELTHSSIEISEVELIPNSAKPILLDIPPEEEEQEDSIPRLLTNICSSDLEASKRFYKELLDFETKYDSDWYVQLCSPHDPEIEFGVIQRNHSLVPNEYQNAPNGMYITFVVPDVNQTYEKALELGVVIVQEPRNEFYGQRRFLAKEPSGCLVDISSPWEAETA